MIPSDFGIFDLGIGFPASKSFIYVIWYRIGRLFYGLLTRTHRKFLMFSVMVVRQAVSDPTMKIDCHCKIDDLIQRMDCPTPIAVCTLFPFLTPSHLSSIPIFYSWSCLQISSPLIFYREYETLLVNLSQGLSVRLSVSEGESVYTGYYARRPFVRVAETRRT